VTDKRLSILIVEDSEDDALLIIRQFKKAGYDTIFKRVETAYQMKTALKDASWDLVISDYNLPEFDAPSALTLLQESGQDIPFIVVSGVIGEETAIALMKAGANDYVMKNNLMRLIPAVNRALGEAQTRRAKQQAEEALFESEAKYRTVVESSLVGVYIIQDSLLCFVNKRWCEIYGYTYDEIVNKVGPLDLTPPEDKKIVEENIRKRLSREIDHIEYETRAMRKDGTIIFVKVLGSFTLYRGRPAISGTVIDITEHKRSEETLRISQAQLFDAMDLARIVYWEVDPTDNAFIFNDAFYAFYGTTAEQEGGYLMPREEYVQRFVHPDDLQLIRQIVEQNITKTDSESLPNFEHRIIRRDGEVRHIQVRVCVVKDDSGRVAKRYGANQDITERKNIEVALAESEERYRTAMECSNDGIAIGKGGLNVYVNRKLLEMFGFEKPEEVLGKPASIIARPEDRKLLMEMNRKRQKGEYVPDKYEFRGLHKDGRALFIEVSAAIFMYRGEPHSLAFLRDITSRKKVEEELVETTEKLRKSLAGTLQAMAHTVEIRDPDTAGHEKRVSALARSIAQEMGLSDGVVNSIRMAGAIHDIGKMSVPAEILSKPTKLSEIEMGLIKIHSQAGYDILTDSQLPYPVAEIVLQHHERLDGSGYPQGLRGDAILLEAQIIAVADTVEAMASHRPYRPALGIDTALEQIAKDKGILYNADVVKACLHLFKEKGFTFG
jgi:PAS domain S-box-containing protein/putative nucleotidyltransferase with HDIG domain